MYSHGNPVDRAKRAEAVRAVRARSRGRDVAAVRDDLRRELAARGMEVPEDRLGLMAEVITRSYGLAGPLRLFKGQLAAFQQIVRVLKESEAPGWLRPPKGSYPQAAAFCSLPLMAPGRFTVSPGI